MSTALRALGGARAGLGATAAMSTLMAARWLVRPGVPPPPRVVTETAAQKAGLKRPLRHPAWLAAHAGFGATLGALYRAGGGDGRVSRGTAYGVACWAANYGVGLPLLRLYPRLDRDDRLRALETFASHVVFGWALARAAAD